MKTTREDNGFEFRPLGQGRQNFAAILEACEAAGTEYVIVEQDKTYGGMTELEAAKLSRDYLKNTFGI
jgi:sugar phosphate isomerase/epimerase